MNFKKNKNLLGYQSLRTEPFETQFPQLGVGTGRTSKTHPLLEN